MRSLQAEELSPYYVDHRGVLGFKTHPGQRKALQSEKRFILVLAGTQGGKTIFGPWWLLREIRMMGPGDYLAVAPTFPLMEKKMLPSFLELFERRLQLGAYVGGSKKVFTFTDDGARRIFGVVPEQPTQIFFGHAQDPESLESATAKAAWLDEAGQKKYKLATWEAIRRRLSIFRGRVLLTTTPYTLGWLKSKLHDPAIEGTRDDVALVQFASNMNPVFPDAEFDDMRRSLPAWKFNMMYRGVFERPAGMIYDCYNKETHTVPRFSIPPEWPRFLGVDFGGVNTVGVHVAEEPEGHPGGGPRYFVHRVYHRGGRTAEEHAGALLQAEPRIPHATGGAPSEDQWRMEFGKGGLPIHAPTVSDVEVGINRVYRLLKEDRLFFFDDLDHMLDEVQSYSRELDNDGEPTEKIEDKSMYHRLDALRYFATSVVGEASPFSFSVPKG